MGPHRGTALAHLREDLNLGIERRQRERGTCDGSRWMSEASRAAVMRDATGMRRHLMLVRHAKSAWNDASLADHDRPLAPRGVKALPRLRDHLTGAVHPPELVLCSTARRTVETLVGIQAAFSESPRIETEEALYGASADVLLGRLRRVDNDIGCAMVIGHNPTLQDLAMLLVGGGEPDMHARLAAKLPTGAAVTLSFDGSWGDLDAGMSRLDDLFMPRTPRS